MHNPPKKRRDAYSPKKESRCILPPKSIPVHKPKKSRRINSRLIHLLFLIFSSNTFIKNNFLKTSLCGDVFCVFRCIALTEEAFYHAAVLQGNIPQHKRFRYPAHKTTQLCNRQSV